MDTTRTEAPGCQDAIDQPEAHFPVDSAKFVNDDIWMELFFEVVKSTRESRSKDVSSKMVLIDLTTQISELADISTGSVALSEVMAETIEAV